MKRKHNAAAALLALTMAVFALIGCTKTAPAVNTIYESNALKIDQQGAETRIYDLEGDAEYTFTTYRRRVLRGTAGTAAQVTEGKTTADTDTIKIQTAHGLIIVTEKTSGTTLYVKGASK